MLRIDEGGHAKGESNSKAEGFARVQHARCDHLNRGGDKKTTGKSKGGAHDRRRHGKKEGTDLRKKSDQNKQTAEREGDRTAGRPRGLGQPYGTGGGRLTETADCPCCDIRQSVCENAPAKRAHLRLLPVHILCLLGCSDSTEGIQCNGECSNRKWHQKRSVEAQRLAEGFGPADPGHHHDILQLPGAEMTGRKGCQTADRNAQE